MIKVKLGSEERESIESWNFKNFFYLKEGQKRKLKIRTLKLLFFGGCVFVVVLQFLKSDSSEYSKESGFSTPQTVEGSKPIEISKYNEYADAQASAQRRNGNSLVLNSGIKRVSFLNTQKIPSGSEVTAQLSSGGSNGTVKAVLSENLVVDGDVLAPKNSILIGQGQSSDERLYIVFTKMIKPEQSEIKIKAQAFDSKDRILGLKGSKVGDFAFKIAASSGLFFLSGMAEGMQNSTGVLGQEKKSVRDAALQGVAQASVEHGRKLVDNMNNKTVIEVKHSTPIVVIFDEGENE
ncbi:MAG: TrbI/VirB10 family protein [Oligoflexia bacterium]|nr:TrbI/VirB10 family protein [Oligoflexia bacterium]